MRAVAEDPTRTENSVKIKYGVGDGRGTAKMRIEKRMKTKRFMLRPVIMRLLMFFCGLAMNTGRKIPLFAPEREQTLPAN